MYVSLTKTLAKKYKLEYGEVPHYNKQKSEFCWHAVIKKHEDVEYLILLNEASRFLVIAEPNDSPFSEQVVSAVTDSLKAMELSEDSISDYFSDAGDFEYGPIRTKSMSSWTNKAVKEAFKRIDYYVSTGTKFTLAEIGPEVSVSPVPSGHGITKPFVPFAQMDRIIEKCDPNYKTVSYPHVLEIRSSLLGTCVKVERTFMVSSAISFYELSQILMKLYNFAGYHLYDFEIFDTVRTRYPNYIVQDSNMDDDFPGSPFGFDFGFNIFNGRPEAQTLSFNTKIGKYLMNCDHTVFTYDFGDDWNINLKVRATLQSSKYLSSYMPYLLSAKGPSPEEDIGGVWGLNDLIEAAKDPEKIKYIDDADLLLEEMDLDQFKPDQELPIPKKILANQWGSIYS